MNKQLQALLQRRQAAVAKMKGISDAAAGAEGGMLTEDQRTAFDAAQTEIAQLDGDIARVRAAIEASREGATVEVPGNILGTSDNRAADPTHGFATLGEFFQAVRNFTHPQMQTRDERLFIGAAAANPGSIGSGEDAGFLAPPQFASEIMQASQDPVEALLPLTDETPLGQANAMTFPVDESTPWGGGIQAYWTGEGQPSQQSKAGVQPATLRLSKLTALIPLTEEQQADAPALEAYLTSKVPMAIMWKTNEALWNGNGVGQPLGVFRSGALVTVAKETSQTAATVVLANITKMRARMPAMSYRRAVWMINNDVLPQLDQLAYGQQQTNVPIYNPTGGAYGYGVLLGRDVMVTQHNETVGTKGDIALIDWKMYRTIRKAAGVQTAQSLHFWFDQGIAAFRAVFRVDGQPIPTKAVTPNKGAATLSPFVVLADRAG